MLFENWFWLILQVLLPLPPGSTRWMLSDAWLLPMVCAYRGLFFINEHHCFETTNFTLQSGINLCSATVSEKRLGDLWGAFSEVLIDWAGKGEKVCLRLGIWRELNPLWSPLSLTSVLHFHKLKWKLFYFYFYAFRIIYSIIYSKFIP